MLMNNTFLENVTKNSYTKFVIAESRRNYLVSELKSHTTKKKGVNRRCKKTHIFMNKLVYLSLLILEISKKVIYGFLHNFIKPI